MSESCGEGAEGSGSSGNCGGGFSLSGPKKNIDGLSCLDGRPFYNGISGGSFVLGHKWVEYLINRERQMMIAKTLLNKGDERLALDAFCEGQAVCIDFPFALKLDSSLSIA